jgi:hypothetical protein
MNRSIAAVAVETYGCGIRDGAAPMLTREGAPENQPRARRGGLAVTGRASIGSSAISCVRKYRNPQRSYWASRAKATPDSLSPALGARAKTWWSFVASNFAPIAHSRPTETSEGSSSHALSCGGTKHPLMPSMRLLCHRSPLRGYVPPAALRDKIVRRLRSGFFAPRQPGFPMNSTTSRGI